MGAPESIAEAFRDACAAFVDPTTREGAIGRFRQLADVGHAAASYNIAVLLLAGRHVAGDDLGAERYLRRAAAQRYPGSYRPLGMMALHGRLAATRHAGGDVRRYLAGQWFVRGWLAGDAEARVLLLRNVSSLFACMTLCPWR